MKSHDASKREPTPPNFGGGMAVSVMNPGFQRRMQYWREWLEMADEPTVIFAISGLRENRQGVPVNSPRVPRSRPGPPAIYAGTAVPADRWRSWAVSLWGKRPTANSILTSCLHELPRTPFNRASGTRICRRSAADASDGQRLGRTLCPAMATRSEPEILGRICWAFPTEHHGNSKRLGQRYRGIYIYVGSGSSAIQHGLWLGCVDMQNPTLSLVDLTGMLIRDGNGTQVTLVATHPALTRLLGTLGFATAPTRTRECNLPGFPAHRLYAERDRRVLRPLDPAYDEEGALPSSPRDALAAPSRTVRQPPGFFLSPRKFHHSALSEHMAPDGEDLRVLIERNPSALASVEEDLRRVLQVICLKPGPSIPSNLIRASYYRRLSQPVEGLAQRLSSFSTVEQDIF